MGVEPVTQGQWHAVMGSQPSRFAGDDRPVECVSWEDCREFCENLSLKTGLGREGPSPYRLPTEAEWEYACRAGTSGAYFFGETLATTQANYHSNGRPRETAPASRLAANAWGLRGLHGNVFEWCADWYGPYPAGAVRDPSGPGAGEVRCLRGGSWNSLAGRCRSACRGWAAPGYRGSDVGLRVCFRVDQHYVI
jgi:formylglycine-generating enzyme required for sulfatase activity